MATMSVNEMLQSLIGGPNTVGFDYREDYSPPSPWQGRTVGSLTQAEKEGLLLGRNSIPGLSTPEGVRQAIAKGSFDYTDRTGGSILGDMSPFLMMAGMAAGAGAFNGFDFGSMFGGAEGALGAGAGAEAPMTGWGAGFEGAGAGGSMFDVTPTSDWMNPDLSPEARGFRAPTSASPRSTVNPWQNVNVAGNYAPVVDLPYTANASELSGLPGAGGTPYAGSPLPGGTGDAWPGMNQFAGPASGGNMDLTDILEQTGNFTTTPPSWSPTMPDVGGQWDFPIPGQTAPIVDSATGLPLNIGDVPYPGTKETGGGVLQQILEKLMGNPTTTLQTLGRLGAAALGYYGALEQSKALTQLAGKASDYGAASRARYESSMTPGFDPNAIPGYAGALDTASKSILAKLSAVGGNPFGNPGGLIDANKAIVSGTAMPAIQEYQRMNANTGFGNSMNSAFNLGSQAIGADANALNAIGYGINQVTNPQPTLADLAKMFSQYDTKYSF